MKTRPNAAVLALSGGIGGAKLALGLAKILAPERLLVIANTGDDFEHLGLHISPDVDTLMYTLAGVNNAETGWGRAPESWHFMEALAELGGETWFQLGDRDLATHVERTRRLAAGESLTEITADLCRRLHVGPALIPASDDPAPTVVLTAQGELGFQHYFVRDRCRPVVTGFRYAGIDRARPSPSLMRALARPDLAAVILCPSNPFLSIDPILALPGVRAALADSQAPLVAVSPIVGNQAVKGPTAKIMAELGLAVTAVSVARHYGELLVGFVLDVADEGLAPQIEALGLRCLVVPTVMETLDDKTALARAVLDFAASAEETNRRKQHRWEERDGLWSLHVCHRLRDSHR